MQTEKMRYFLLKAGYIAVWTAIVIAAVICAGKLLMPFILGFFIAFLVRPVAGFIGRHSKMGGRGAAIAAALLLYAVLGVLLWVLGAFLYLQLDRLFALLPEVYGKHLAPALQELNRRSLGIIQRMAPQLGTSAENVFTGLETAAENAVETFSGWCMEKGGALLHSVPTLLLTLLFTILSSVLICADYETVTGFLLRQIPARWHQPLLQARDFLVSTLARTLRAYLILTALTFIQLVLGLWVLQIPGLWGIAVATAFLDLLPVLGSGIVLIPWGVYCIVTGQVGTGGGLLVMWAIISLVRQLLEPRIVGSQLGLHPLATVTAMYCGFRLLGFGGLILAPVVCLLVKYLREKKLLVLYR